MPSAVHFGEDVLSQLAAALRARQARRVFLITGPSRRFVDEVRAALEPVDLLVFDQAKVHVPVEVVEAAETAFAEFRPDAVVALGGGAATGLGKVLRVRHGGPLFAVPTTYSGSEMTAIYGLTRAGTKETERDDRARPDGVFYGPQFTAELPLSVKMKSLFNALAHSVSALSAGSLDDEGRSRALEAITMLAGAASQLAETPTGRQAQVEALRGASLSGAVLDRGHLGLHHRLAHDLGGRFALEHSGLHAVLLSHTLRLLADEQPDTYAAVETAGGVPDLPGQLFDLLRRVGAETSLKQLGVSWAGLQEFLESDPERPAGALEAAFHGRRPSRRQAQADWGLRQPVVVAGADLAAATTVVVAVHGRGSTAESIVGRVFEVAGHEPSLSIVAPQAVNNAWYENSYRDALETIGSPGQTAIDEVRQVVERVRADAPSARIVLFGFSQGSCVALECAARSDLSVDAVVAFAGARLGPSADYAPAPSAWDGQPILLGVAAGDDWVDGTDVRATAAWFEAAQARPELLMEPGETHEMFGRQRVRAREVILGRSIRQGDRGYGNAHESEALPGALPRRMNSPRRVRYGLYAEQINGTGFVAARHENFRSWMYRVRPSAQHGAFQRIEHPTFRANFGSTPADPTLRGYAPIAMPESPTDFVDGLKTFGGAGRPELRRGFAIHLYVANRSMDHRCLYNSDGDFLIVPQEGKLELLTEMGVLDVPPGHVALIPRGIKFSVLLDAPEARGYVAEVYGRHFELPERGPVGANGLTEPRHFVSPTAWYEDRLDPGYRVASKFAGEIFEATQDYSPYDVVAWHGNYTPYVYDLLDFGPVSNVRFDHPDPSIYTVLSAPMDEQGANTLDFVFFPPRWDATEGTFRPPFFHRNATTEFNGIIKDPQGDRPPFYAGGYFLTPSMTAHGVRATATQRAMMRREDPPPHRFSERSMWFQFESALPIGLTPWALESANRMTDWLDVWGTYRTHFSPFEPTDVSG